MCLVIQRQNSITRRLIGVLMGCVHSTHYGLCTHIIGTSICLLLTIEFCLRVTTSIFVLGAVGFYMFLLRTSDAHLFQNVTFGRKCVPCVWNTPYVVGFYVFLTYSDGKRTDCLGISLLNQTTWLGP